MFYFLSVHILQYASYCLKVLTLRAQTANCDHHFILLQLQEMRKLVIRRMLFYSFCSIDSDCLKDSITIHVIFC